MSARGVLNNWFAAFNAHDLEELCRLADPGIELLPLGGAVTTPPGAWYHGHDGLRSLLAAGFERFPRLRIEPGPFRELGDRLLVDIDLILDDGRGVAEARSAACIYEITGSHVRRVEAYEPEALPAAIPGRSRNSELSPREHEVLMLLANGRSVDQIAAQLVISPLTVRTHVRNAKGKLDARTTAHAVALALRSAADDSA